MNARRIFATAAFALVSAATAACGGGGGPTLTDSFDDDNGRVQPFAPPTDTSAFVPDPSNSTP